MAQKTTEKRKPDLRKKADVHDFGIAGPNCASVRTAKKLGADGQERTVRQFFMLVLEGKADELAKQMARLEKAGFDIRQVINAKAVADYTMLMRASQKGFTRICAMLLGIGADIEAIDTDSRTPLMHAARWGHVETCRLLVEEGADARKENALGWTASMVAKHYGHSDAASFLESVESAESKWPARETV